MRTALIVGVVLVLAGSVGIPASTSLSPVGSALAAGCPRAGHPPPEPVPPGDGQDLAGVLERYVAACGGRDAIGRVESRVVVARVVTDLPSRQPPVFEVDSLTVYSKGPDRYLTLHRTTRGTVAEGFDGFRNWKRDVDGKAFDVDASSGRDAWLTDPRFAVRLENYFPEMSYLGVALLEGRPYHVVDTDGDHSHRLYFDPDTGLLVRLGYNTKILRYGETDGLLVPREVEHSRKGGSSTYILDSVVHNATIDERLFVSPGSY